MRKARWVAAFAACLLAGCGGEGTSRLQAGSRAILVQADGSRWVTTTNDVSNETGSMSPDVGTEVTVISDDKEDPGLGPGNRPVLVRVKEGRWAGQNARFPRENLRATK